MELISPEFLVLVSLALVLFHACRNPGWQRFVLTAGGIVFFLSNAAGGAAASGWQALLSLSMPIGFIVAGYAGMRVVRVHPKLAAPLSLVLAVLFLVCRHVATAAEGGAAVFVTVGFSYIILRILHVILDVSWNEIAETPSPYAYVGYVLFFPTFLAGPIWLYQDYALELRRARTAPNGREVQQAFSRIATGLLKVLVLSNATLALHRFCVRAILENPSNARALAGVLFASAALLYLAYVYYDFSGYMDIVVGVGRLFDVRLPENFDRPFESRDLLDFWNRWHITLSQWMQRFVFTPLTVFLVRRLPGPKLDYAGPAGYFLVFLLVGVWHSPSWRFLCFGAFLGLAASATKILENSSMSRLGRAKYNAMRGRATVKLLFRCACAFVVAVALSFLWLEASVLKAFGFPDLLSALAAGLLVPCLFSFLSEIAQRYSAAMERAAGGEVSAGNLLRLGWGQVWLAVKVFVVVGILVSRTEDIPVFIYQGF